MWSSKESLWSNLTPNSFSLLLLVMSKFPIFILTVLFVIARKGHLLILIFIKLSLNHLNKISEAFSKDLITPSIQIYFISTNVWCVFIGITSNISILDYKKQIVTFVPTWIFQIFLINLEEFSLICSLFWYHFYLFCTKK